MSTTGGSTASHRTRPFFAQSRGLPQGPMGGYQIGRHTASPAAVEWWDTHVYRTHLRSPITSRPGSARDSRPTTASIGLSPRSIKARGLSARPSSAMGSSQALGGARKEGLGLQYPDPMMDETPMMCGGTADHPLKAELSQVYRALRLVDLNGDGQLAPTDIVRGLSSFGLAVGHNQEATKAVNSLLMRNMQGNGTILYQPFVYQLSRDQKTMEIIMAKKENKAAAYKKALADYNAGVPADLRPTNRGAQLRPGVTANELRQAQTTIKDKLSDKFSSFTAAFRSMDKDGSGYVSRTEIQGMLLNLNLSGIRKDVIDTLIDFVDCDNDVDDDDDEGDTDIGYREFARAFTSDDIMNMQKLSHRPAAAPPPPPTPPPQNLTASNVSALIATKFKPTEIKDAFNFFDKDKSRTLTRAEMRRILATWGMPLTDEELNDLFTACDKDGDGKIDYKEFCDMVAKNPAISHTREVVKIPALRKGVRAGDLRRAQRTIQDHILTKFSKIAEAFKFIDKDRTNSITRDELKLGLQELQLIGTIRPEVVDNLIDFIDIDPEGDIEYREFARVISADDVMSMAPLKVHVATNDQRTDFKRRGDGTTGLAWHQISG